jgi:hypothetical protein
MAAATGCETIDPNFRFNGFGAGHSRAYPRPVAQNAGVYELLVRARSRGIRHCGHRARWLESPKRRAFLCAVVLFNLWRK